MNEIKKGLHRKFNVTRTDPDAQERHKDCEFFVLEVTHDPTARHALESYAWAIKASNPTLAAELFAWLLRLDRTEPLPEGSER